MSDIIFKDVSLTKRAPAWKFLHSNEEKKLAKCQLDNCSEVINWKKWSKWFIESLTTYDDQIVNKRDFLKIINL